VLALSKAASEQRSCQAWLLLFVQRDNAETDELRACNALQSSGAGSGPGSWLLLGDSASDELLAATGIRTPAFLN
jgi:hypothetical protein